MINCRHAIIALIAAACALPPVTAYAAGALAVGITEDSEDGFAFGTAWNYESEKEARSAALRRCRATEDAHEAVKHCRLVGSFKKGCLAIAFDPQEDSPGVGWSIAEDRTGAEARALTQCRAAAPAARRPFCKTATSRCEGEHAN